MYDGTAPSDLWYCLRRVKVLERLHRLRQVLLAQAR